MISIPLGSAGVHTEHTADPSRPQTSQEYGRRQRERQNHLYHSGLAGSTLNGMWEVDITLIADWLRSLDQTSYEQVIAALEVLRDRGPSLGRPLVDTITASRHLQHEGASPRLGRAIRGSRPFRLWPQAHGDLADRGRQGWQLDSVVQEELPTGR